MPVQKQFASWCGKKNSDCNKNIWVSVQRAMHEISGNDICHSTDFVDIGGKPLIKKCEQGKKVQFQMVSLINGLMILIYSVIVAPVLYVAEYLHFYYYGGVIISRLCIVQHSMIGVMLNL
jgi:hypothetical protein